MRLLLDALEVSIPFIAGQWSLHAVDLHGVIAVLRVSIPFIAGQWSLLIVVVSLLTVGLLVSIPFIAGQWSLQEFYGILEFLLRTVSIPFIAGQWSLPRRDCESCRRIRKFQSPSLRGSGRFSFGTKSRIDDLVLFQSPSLRGSGRFGLFSVDITCQKKVSIPFIAGQWSLLYGLL